MQSNVNKYHGKGFNYFFSAQQVERQECRDVPRQVPKQVEKEVCNDIPRQVIN